MLTRESKIKESRNWRERWKRDKQNERKEKIKVSQTKEIKEKETGMVWKEEKESNGWKEKWIKKKEEKEEKVRKNEKEKERMRKRKKEKNMETGANKKKVIFTYTTYTQIPLGKAWTHLFSTQLCID